MNLRSAGRMGLPDRPSKHEAFLALLREGWTSLHLDARRAGVVVPVHLQGEGHLVLQYGNDLPIPIPDLQVDDGGVTATLSFARAPHYTVVPWSAVYVVASDDGRGVLYHEDVPPDVSVIARGEVDSSGEGATGVDGAIAGRPAADSLPVLRPTPARMLRAVPLAGPFDEAPRLDDVHGRAEDNIRGNVGMLGAARDSVPAMPARRRKRPQLRLVK